MGFLIDMINVGQGDCFLLTLDVPAGGEVNVLIDAGVPDSGATVVNYLKSYAPNGLGLLIATHIDNDHIGGIKAVLENIKVAELVINVPPKLTEIWYPLRPKLDSYKDIRQFGRLTDTIDAVQEICATANRLGVKISQAVQGRGWMCGDVAINVLNPTPVRLAAAWEESSLLSYVQRGMPKQLVSALLSLEKAEECDAPGTSAENDSSVVLEIMHKNQPYALMAGDAGAAVLKEVTLGKKYNFLKVPHHGSKTGMDAELAKQLSATTAYIPVGENPHGHPCIEILDILRDAGTVTYCSNKTRDCRQGCAREGGYGHLSHMVEKSGHANWRTVEAAQCGNNGKRRGVG